MGELTVRRCTCAWGRGWGWGLGLGLGLGSGLGLALGCKAWARVRVRVGSCAGAPSKSSGSRSLDLTGVLGVSDGIGRVAGDATRSAACSVAGPVALSTLSARPAHPRQAQMHRLTLRRPRPHRPQWGRVLRDLWLIIALHTSRAQAPLALLRGRRALESTGATHPLATHSARSAGYHPAIRPAARPAARPAWGWGWG
eukprot:scaffold103092_cov36-Phaeocystis_antarctica.AAC.1